MMGNDRNNDWEMIGNNDWDNDWERYFTHFLINSFITILPDI